MLLLLQTAAQQLPPINVTVQPPAGGLPESVKILISASVGAMFGIGSNIAMEFVKPWIAKRLTRRTMADHLGNELVDNQSKVEAADRILTETAGKEPQDREYAQHVCKVIAATIDSDRFDHFFASQKAVLYELDEGRALTTFYQITKTFRTLERGYKETHQTFKMAAAMGRMYIKVHGLAYNPPPNSMETVFRKQMSEPDATS
jgi:hypothetical protein